MKWEHLLEGISVIDSVCWHDYWVSHCGKGRTLKDGGLDTRVSLDFLPLRRTQKGFLHAVNYVHLFQCAQALK